MQTGVEKKTEKFKENITRITELKKRLIEAEISLLDIKRMLNLSYYDWKKFLSGELREQERKVEELIDKVPSFIKDKDKELKEFQKLLLEKGLRIKDVENKTKLNRNKIYRVIRKEHKERDTAAEKIIERVIGESNYFAR
ncbi:hypothetical protein [Fusobacterium ulcerans]|uniref:hypothetical protein n=1 Tax=Fusobacterium ulcerans TaxID=861 RepID=UPI0027B9D3A7|nr:hypothetical protein [Fusobacterium ulcerans]